MLFYVWMQKYRSHRKHLLAREAEAASWSQRRQLYAGGGKREGNPWLAPIMGFPPMTTPMHHFRPLHVWGHPSMSLVHMWPKHLSNSPPLLWPLSPPAVPPQDPSFWQQLVSSLNLTNQSNLWFSSILDNQIIHAKYLSILYQIKINIDHINWMSIFNKVHFQSYILFLASCLFYVLHFYFLFLFPALYLFLCLAFYFLILCTICIYFFCFLWKT